MRYYTQTKAPAGNYTDALGSDSKEACISQADYYNGKGMVARVIERVDTVVYIHKDLEPSH